MNVLIKSKQNSTCSGYVYAFKFLIVPFVFALFFASCENLKNASQMCFHVRGSRHVDMLDSMFYS